VAVLRESRKGEGVLGEAGFLSVWAHAGGEEGEGVVKPERVSEFLFAEI